MTAMVKRWCPHLKCHIDQTEWLYQQQSPFRCVCGRVIGQTVIDSFPHAKWQPAVGVNPKLPDVQRPPSKGGNFLKPALVGKSIGEMVDAKIIRVKLDQDLPNSGLTTVLDLEVNGKIYGFPLNVGAHKAMCLFWPGKKPETFDSDAPVGKTIKLQVRTAPDVKSPGEDREVFRIVTPPKK
jgi:hypothetical protein